MQDFTLDKGKLAIILAGLFCLYAVYGAVSDFKLPGEAEALEPAQEIVELDPVNIRLLTKTYLFGTPPQAKVAVTKKATNKTNTANAAGNAKKNQQAKAKQEQKEQKKRNTKPIKINVTVTGLLASVDENFASAMLKVDNKPEKLYKVGEDLGKPEVKLQSVEIESVTIDNNGNEQTIAMKRPGLESTNKAGNKKRATQSNNNSNSNRIPELPPELELPEELQLLNESSVEGAYSPPPPEPVDFNEPSLREELEEELLLEQMQDELDADIQAELDLNSSNGNLEVIPPLTELDGGAASAPNFQMPVF